MWSGVVPQHPPMIVCRPVRCTYAIDVSVRHDILDFSALLLANFVVADLEPVSEPPKYDHHAGDLGEGVKEEQVEFVARYEPPEGL